MKLVGLLGTRFFDACQSAAGVHVQVEVEVHYEQVAWVNKYGERAQELREMKNGRAEKPP